MGRIYTGQGLMTATSTFELRILDVDAQGGISNPCTFKDTRIANRNLEGHDDRLRQQDDKNINIIIDRMTVLSPIDVGVRILVSKIEEVWASSK